jgi:hypothetical protein
MNTHTKNWKLTDDGKGIYALGEDGTNVFFIQVQPGFVNGERTSDEELQKVAKLAGQAPDLLELLNKTHMALQLAYANLSLTVTEDSKWEIYNTIQEVKKVVNNHKKEE